jgi:hypothetical protein
MHFDSGLLADYRSIPCISASAWGSFVQNSRVIARNSELLRKVMYYWCERKVGDRLDVDVSFSQILGESS